MDQQRPASEPGGETAGAGDEAAHAEHGRRAPAAQRAEGFDDGGREPERRRGPGHRAAAPHAGDRNPLDLDAMLRHEPRFEPALRAEPYDVAFARFELGRDREAGEHVPTGSTRHDHDRAGTHRTYPRCTRRFCPPYSS